MSHICEDLFDVAETLEHFAKFLGNKLKTVTGDAQSTCSVSKKRRQSASLLVPLFDGQVVR